MPVLSQEQLEDLLCEVEKPVRYVGNEWNSTVQDGPDIDFRVALAYPDTYEIGMSHLGFRILYSLLNAKDGVAAERVFAPWPDLEKQLRARELPLYTLETKRPVGELDMVGFSLQYEMTLTNILTMLDLGGIPAFAADREDGHPIIAAGGPVAMNPEPFADFFDLIAIGDGEELFPELIDRARELREGGATRADIVSELGKVPGVYAPAHYQLEVDESTGLQVVVGSESHPFPVKRRLLMDLARHPFPEEIIVPFCEVVHSRVAVEIMRGCNVGCRFCQAGYIYRPERIRTPEQVMKTVFSSAEKTGFDEVSLTSLNTGEYPQIENLVSKMMDRFEQSSTGVSLPSLRASSLKDGLLDEIKRVRKSGLTIAPEGGTQRMRDVINKNISDEDIENAAEAVYSHGWDLIKLYFMIGQPTEREDDVIGIAETARKVHSIGRKHRGGRAKVNLGVSSFIPKPFTPFQWMPMERSETLMEKQALIARSLGDKRIKFGRHHVETSVLESAFSRADRRMAKVIHRAWLDGARFDGWTECFDMELWKKAFEKEGLDLEAYAHREFATDDRLPWDHVDIGVRKAYLVSEWEKAQAAEVVSICASDDCHGCGSFVKECLTGNASHGRKWPERRPREETEPTPAPPSHGYRLAYEKRDWLRFISHLDLVRTLRHAFRRAGLELAHSEGFHPMPKLSFAPPLPLGTEGAEELMDMQLIQPIPAEELQRKINAQLPPGLRVTNVRALGAGDPKLSRIVNAAKLTVRLTEEDWAGQEPQDAVAALMAKDDIPVTRTRKGREKTVNLRPGIFSLEADGPLLRAEVLLLGEGNVRPIELVEAVLGRKVTGARFVREQLLWSEDGQLTSSLVLGTVSDAA
ncbi:MAG: TIGR03960 family B12-binding radical SAM protein [Acidobacteriota bacterium]